MKFAAATMFPGLANMSQKGTEPSPKSTQSVPLSGSPQGPLASAGAAGRSMAAATTTAARSTFRIARLCSRNAGQLLVTPDPRDVDRAEGSEPDCDAPARARNPVDQAVRGREARLGRAS